MPDQPLNFLADYRLFTSGNEAHPNYHIWSGLVALSSIISRRIWLDFDYFKISTNLYVVLLGPPGNKKTTAMRLAKGVIHKLCAKDPNAIPFSAQCQSKENLVKELAGNQRKFQLPSSQEVLDYTPISIFVTELSQFLGTTTAGHMLDFLTTVWDGDPYDRSTNLHGKEFIPNPYVTLLGCTVPSWITTYLKTDVITGGFSRRAIFVYEERDGDPIPFPRLTEEQVAAYARVIERGTQLLKIGGQFQWDPEAKEFYDDWYRRHQRNLPSDENLQFYYKTKWTQMLKVAMLYTVSHTDELVLKRPAIDAALAILALPERNLPKVFLGVGRNELSTISGKVIELIAANGGPMLRKKVESVIWKDAAGNETYQILSHLLQSEKLFAFRETLPNGVTREWLALPEHVEQLKQDPRFKQ